MGLGFGGEGGEISHPKGWGKRGGRGFEPRPPIRIHKGQLDDPRRSWGVETRDRRRGKVRWGVDPHRLPWKAKHEPQERTGILHPTPVGGPTIPKADPPPSETNETRGRSRNSRRVPPPHHTGDPER
eukprot:scaffold923_cov288-Pavlova_lutheri.AAC.4